MSFNGVNSQATGVPVASTTRSLTMAAWVRLEPDPGHDYETIVSENGNYTFGFILRVIRDQWYFGTSSSDTPGAGVPISSPTPARIGAWTYVAGVYDASQGQMRLYVNGKLSNSHTAPTPFDATQSLTVGCDPFKGKPSWYDGHFSGQIDDLRIYNTALTGAQIGQLHSLTS